MQLPEVDILEWTTSGQTAELAVILQNPLLRMALRIVAESMLLVTLFGLKDLLRRKR